MAIASRIARVYDSPRLCPVQVMLMPRSCMRSEVIIVVYRWIRTSERYKFLFLAMSACVYRLVSSLSTVHYLVVNSLHFLQNVRRFSTFHISRLCKFLHIPIQQQHSSLEIISLDDSRLKQRKNRRSVFLDGRSTGVADNSISQWDGKVFGHHDERVTYVPQCSRNFIFRHQTNM